MTTELLVLLGMLLVGGAIGTSVVVSARRRRERAAHYRSSVSSRLHDRRYHPHIEQSYKARRIDLRNYDTQLASLVSAPQEPLPRTHYLPDEPLVTDPPNLPSPPQQLEHVSEGEFGGGGAGGSWDRDSESSISAYDPSDAGSSDPDTSSGSSE